jgi:hypothetical protein
VKSSRTHNWRKLEDAYTTGSLYEERNLILSKTAHKSWSKEEIEQLIELRAKKHLSWRAIGAKLNRTISSVHSVWHEHIPAERKPESQIKAIGPKKRYTLAEDETIISLHDAGSTSTQIAAIMPQRSLGGIRNRLRYPLCRAGRYRGDPRIWLLRQELIDLRAQGVPWEEIYSRYPTFKKQYLVESARDGRVMGLKPSQMKTNHGEQA